MSDFLRLATGWGVIALVAGIGWAAIARQWSWRSHKQRQHEHLARYLAATGGVQRHRRLKH